MTTSVGSVILKTGLSILLLPATALISELCNRCWNPFRRGFFCDDETIRLPDLGSTVSTFEMNAVGLTIPLLLILYCEYFHCIKKKQNLDQYRRSVFKKIVCLSFGLAFEYVTVFVGKVTTSRLRPNFIVVCGIDLDTVCRNNTHRYVSDSDYICPNGEDRASDSRVSFPSGHSAFSAYVAVFTVIYLQQRCKFGPLFWRPLIQVCVVILAWWVSMTRIMDNQHHYSDVLVGIVIGISVGIVNTVYIHSLDGDTEEDSYSNLNGCFSPEEASEKRRLIQDEDSNR